MNFNTCPNHVYLVKFLPHSSPLFLLFPHLTSVTSLFLLSFLFTFAFLLGDNRKHWSCINYAILCTKGFLWAATFESYNILEASATITISPKGKWWFWRLVGFSTMASGWAMDWHQKASGSVWCLNSSFVVDKPPSLKAEKGKTVQGRRGEDLSESMLS